jgi:superfamily II DNA or RNA helicase
LSRLQAVFQPRTEQTERGRLLAYAPDGGAPDPADLQRWGLPPGRPETAVLALTREGEVVLGEVDCRALELSEALGSLYSLPLAGAGPWRAGPSDSLRTWALAARLAVHLVSAQRVLPALVRSDGTVHATWQAAVDSDPAWRAAVSELAGRMPPAAHALPVDTGAVWHAEALVEAFLDAVADLAARDSAVVQPSGRPRARVLPWTARWAEALADPDDPTVPLGSDAEELVAGVTSWTAGGSDEPTATLELRLVPAPTAEDPWMLELGLRSPDGRQLHATEVWSDAAGPEAGELLVGLARAARVFEPLERVLDEPAPTGLALTIEEAWHLLGEAAALLAEAGTLLRVPDKLDPAHLRLRLRLDTDADQPLAEEVSYRWEVALGDEVLDDEAATALADAAARSSTPLVRWQEHWLWVDQATAPGLGRLRTPGTLPGGQALALALGGEVPLGELVPPDDPAPPQSMVEVVASGGLGDFVDRLRDARAPEPVPVTPPGFDGELRPYQRRGVAWLRGMRELGLGAVLADAMGLGKTIQLIAHLLAEAPGGRHLVVAPTSVVGNWQRELDRFAPELPVTRWHGADRPDDAEPLRGVVVTSYGTLRRDVDLLAAVDWGVVALDEAQQVKNPATAGARAVRRLPRAQTVALTGTPLENRLAELWALLDATNPGIVGTQTAFERRFAAPIEHHRDPVAARRLRSLVAPFVLRREKTDPQIAADLPPRIERTVVCGLTEEQARLYTAAVDDTLSEAASTGDRGKRRMHVLALLTRLKQICNHPAHFLAEPVGQAVLPARSGKLAAATEILAEAAEGGEQALVFTQYVVMGHLLVAHLESELGVGVPFLHGSLPAGRRDLLVDSFQGDLEAAGRLGWDSPPPVFVVSLRAGGTGLNLTAATQVLHYDRWWNPAVEDQATDRAHRIGQDRPVEVHKLVTSGTVEERIADLLERKRALADDIVGAGESWIADLDDDELEALVRLSAEPMAVEEEG